MAIVRHADMETTNVDLRKAGSELEGGTDKLGYKIPQETSGQIYLHETVSSETKLVCL